MRGGGRGREEGDTEVEEVGGELGWEKKGRRTRLTRKCGSWGGEGGKKKKKKKKNKKK
jgi:hypothetical protein